MMSQSGLKRSFFRQQQLSAPGRRITRPLLSLFRRHGESFLLFEEICVDDNKGKMFTKGRERWAMKIIWLGWISEKILNALLTCDLHLSGATVLLTTGSDGLLHVIILFLRLSFLNVMIVTQLWQLSFEVWILCIWIKTLDMIQSINCRHFVDWHSFPFVVLLNSRRSSWLKVKIPMWRCFWFIATCCFNMSKRNHTGG